MSELTKMVMIVYNEALDLEVMEALEQAGLKDYTKVMAAFGRGASSGTHLGNDIWPGRNNILYVACADIIVPKLLSGIGELKKKFSTEGVKAFVLPVADSV
ncbi:MAG: hypothetical protein Q8N85_06015 [Candidatus Omnitrophota bacterium]|nr:hypothetical protein [Candidatus Omnitrophota bacterium]